MPEWLSALGSKIAISSASAVVIFIAGRSWNGFLKPSIVKLWYRGTRLEACYIGEFELDGKEVNDLIELKQRADRVWGKMTFPKGRAGTYQFEGSIRDNVLRGTFEGIRNNPPSRGSFLLTITPGHNFLEGWFVEPLDGKVRAFEYKWRPRQ